MFDLSVLVGDSFAEPFGLLTGEAELVVEEESNTDRDRKQKETRDRHSDTERDEKADAAVDEAANVSRLVRRQSQQ